MALLNIHLFPLYACHADVHCYRCDTHIGDEMASQATGYPPHRGQWRQRCIACKLWTYYDVRKKEDHGGHLR
jgi:hypothetical protein